MVPKHKVTLQVDCRDRQTDTRETGTKVKIRKPWPVLEKQTFHIHSYVPM